MKVLVIGKGGQLSQALLKSSGATGFEVCVFGRKEFDLEHPNRGFANLNDLAPKVVINAGAYTAVDAAESDSETADKVNHLGPVELAKWCDDNDALLVHYSTDYVFDGKSSEPYTEADLTSPVNFYGETKLRGERGIAEVTDKYFCFRVSWLYGNEGKNFYQTMINLASQKQELSIVSDQTGAPNSVTEIARGTWEVLTRNSGAKEDYGIYHMSGQKWVSWYGFAKEIFSQMSCRGLATPLRVTAIDSSQYPTAAQRPAYSCLDSRKLKNVFGVEIADWKSQLSWEIKERYGN